MINAKKSSLLPIIKGVFSLGISTLILTRALASDTRILKSSRGGGNCRLVVHSFTPKTPSTSKVLIRKEGLGRRSVPLRVESNIGFKSSAMAISIFTSASMAKALMRSN